MEWSGVNNALILDTGWYDIRDSKLYDEVNRGKDKGCEFFNNQCNGNQKFDEFCQENNVDSINFTYSGEGSCTNKDPLTNNCKYVL